MARGHGERGERGEAIYVTKVDVIFWPVFHFFSLIF